MPLFADAADAAALMPKNATTQSRVRGQSRPGAAERVTQLAGLLVAGGADGVTSRDLSEKLGLSDSKGLSPYVVALRRQIEGRAKSSADAFVWQERDEDGTRRWFANAAKLREIGLT